LCRGQNQINAILAFKISARAEKTELLAVAVDIVVSRNAEYPLPRNAGCFADDIEKRCCQFVLLRLSGKGEVACGKNEIHGNALLALPRDIFAHSFQHDIL
jgi:hypothetical protein